MSGLVSKQRGYISTSDLIVEKRLLFKNGLGIESIFLKAFHMLLTERNCYNFHFSPAHHLIQVSCGPEKKRYTYRHHLALDLQK